MNALYSIASGLSRFVIAIGKAGAWACVALIVVILSDVILRRYFVIGSTKLQELEWHLHGILFLLTLGFAYLHGAHVRIELFREKWSARTKAWVELAGIIVFLLPFTLTAIWFGLDYVKMSYLNQEVSASLTGLPYRWLIKSMLVAGLGLLTLAGISQALLLVLYLFGPKAIVRKLDLHAIIDDTPHEA